MPSVNLSAETYEKLKDYAAREGTSPDEAAQRLIDAAASSGERDAGERRSEWEAALREIRSNLPQGLTEEDVEHDVAAALQSVRAGRRAGGR